MSEIANSSPEVFYLLLDADVFEYFESLDGDLAANVNRVLREYMERIQSTL